MEIAALSLKRILKAQWPKVNKWSIFRWPSILLEANLERFWEISRGPSWQDPEPQHTAGPTWSFLFQLPTFTRFFLSPSKKLATNPFYPLHFIPHETDIFKQPWSSSYSSLTYHHLLLLFWTVERERYVRPDISSRFCVFLFFIFFLFLPFSNLINKFNIHSGVSSSLWLVLILMALGLTMRWDPHGCLAIKWWDGGLLG